ncbi:MAG: hypothetical protein DYG83_17180 [Candidatus Brocadia sp. AMX2]|uniref:Uncharacterized protein n=1 Tax=Candidatus Brocadia sinica JPN1 TaxID=1197129 RepID=A0ABQ0K0T6_9BACT|nr:MAG: hypothetical protein EDM70_17175 [Candidatus Brocadia sp. AMX2]MBC6933949.1 hypothetical protein [Candidatus Brocadia sp.]MBL1170025.1 hypothetical protein [Candidatus Brocadia sp. AMX1]GAN34646.1 hypothetical protein BROSI_A3189 [Candidatus Brocadia sinica JPN1]GIK11671.1 MAG: hypothetical protein BroJett002_03780 [Candidatus Brocadia sinica]
MKSITVTKHQTHIYVHSLDKEFQEFEIWIKYTNYKLFLEHTHSNEYYKQKQLDRREEGENSS